MCPLFRHEPRADDECLIRRAASNNRFRGVRPAASRPEVLRQVFCEVVAISGHSIVA